MEPIDTIRVGNIAGRRRPVGRRKPEPVVDGHPGAAIASLRLRRRGALETLLRLSGSDRSD